MSQKKGYEAEVQACRFLQKQGLKWVASNYRCRLGEIDLIMRDGLYLVFVEVKARTSSRFGQAADNVHYHKRQKMIKTSLFYLQFNQLLEKQAIRFDVISFDGVPAKISWIKNAFGTDP